MSYAAAGQGGRDMPNLCWLVRRVRALRVHQQEVERRERRANQQIAEARQTIDRVERLVKDMKQMGDALR